MNVYEKSEIYSNYNEHHVEKFYLMMKESLLAQYLQMKDQLHA